MTKFILCFLFAFPALAQTTTTTTNEPAAAPLSPFESELDVNVSGGFYRKYKDVNGNEHTESNVQVAYLQNFHTPFQLGGALGMYSNDSKSYLTIYATGVANLLPDYTNAFYIAGSAGAKTVDLIDENNPAEIKQKANFYGQLAIGRRINIRKHISYKPFIAVSKAGNLTPEYSVNFINFSINW